MCDGDVIFFFNNAPLYDDALLSVIIEEKENREA